MKHQERNVIFSHGAVVRPQRLLLDSLLEYSLLVVLCSSVEDKCVGVKWAQWISKETDFLTLAIRRAVVVFIFVEMEHLASVEVTFVLTRDSHPTSTGYSIRTLMNKSKIQSVLLLFLIPFFNPLDFINFFGPCCMGGILVPQPGIEPMSPEVEAQSPKPWTSREFPVLGF